MTLLYSICMVIIYSLTCLGIGQLAMSVIRAGVYRETVLESTFDVATFILGQAVIAVIWISIGLVGQLNIIVVTTVISIGIIPILVGYKKHIQFTTSALISGWQWLLQTDIVFRIICFGIIGLLVLDFLSAALTGPLGDAEAYYMVYSKIMAASGYISEMPGAYSAFSQIGMLGELHFAALMTLGVAESSKLFVWPVAVSAGLMLVSICKLVGIGKRGQWFAFIILFTSTGFSAQVWDGKVDVFPVALALAAIFWLLREEKVTTTSMRMMGLLSGFAMVAKFSYIPILIPSFFLLISWRLYVSLGETFNLREYILNLIRHSLTLGIWALLAWGPHLIKNWVLFNEPLAPFIGLSESGLSLPWFSPEGTAWILKTYPLALVFGRYPGQSGNLSFLWLAFLPMVFFLPWAKSFVRSSLVQVTVVGIVGVVIWMILRPSWMAPRYIFISLALLIPVVAWGVEQFYEKEQSPYLLRSTILITILFAFLFSSYPHIKNKVVTKVWNLDAQGECALSGEYCPAFNKLNSIANPGARMYFSGYYGYWARPDILQCQLSNSEKTTLKRIKDVNEQWAYLLDRGVEYIVVDRESHAKIIQEFGTTSPRWVSRELIVESKKLMIWKIQPNKPDYSAKAKCNVNNTDNWVVYE